jgi:hypothetical protein
LVALIACSSLRVITNSCTLRSVPSSACLGQPCRLCSSGTTTSTLSAPVAPLALDNSCRVLWNTRCSPLSIQSGSVGLPPWIYWNEIGLTYYLLFLQVIIYSLALEIKMSFDILPHPFIDSNSYCGVHRGCPKSMAVPYKLRRAGIHTCQ